jgi:hypothetical protein
MVLLRLGNGPKKRVRLWRSRSGRTIAKTINAVRETLFLFTTLMCRHKDVRERVSEFNETERGCRGGERDLTSEQEATKCQSS